MKKIISYFLQGLIYIVPITVTVYVIYKFFQVIDGLLPFDQPGVGILVILGLITVLGFLGSTIIARPFSLIFDTIVEKAPLIKIIYTSVKDLLTAVVGQKKAFQQPVLVKLSKESNIEKLGFITQEDLSMIGIKEGKIAVYLPHSYNFSGNLFIVERQNVTPVKGASADVMKFIISGGISALENGKKKINSDSA